MHSERFFVKNRAKPWTFDSLVMPDEVTQSTKDDGGSLLRVLFSGSDMCKYTPKHSQYYNRGPQTDCIYGGTDHCVKRTAPKWVMTFKERGTLTWLINKSAL